MGDGITNIQIEKFFKSEENDDIRNNFVGVFSMDDISKYIKFNKIIREKKKGKYPFAIYNTDPHNKPGTHWWSFIDINPRNELLLFDSFGLLGFKLFIEDDDKKIIDALLYNFNKCKFSEANKKINICTMTFDVLEWDKLRKNKKKMLSETAQYFFHLLYEFAKYKQSKNMTIAIVENDLQDIKSSTCGIFQLFFYKNLFDPPTTSQIINKNILNTSTVKILLNEIFTTKTEENEKRIKIFKQEFIG